VAARRPGDLAAAAGQVTPADGDGRAVALESQVGQAPDAAEVAHDLLQQRGHARRPLDDRGRRRVVALDDQAARQVGQRAEAGEPHAGLPRAGSTALM
jgi:hypothetical protein